MAVQQQREEHQDSAETSAPHRRVAAVNSVQANSTTFLYHQPSLSAFNSKSKRAGAGRSGILLLLAKVKLAQQNPNGRLLLPSSCQSSSL